MKELLQTSQTEVEQTREYSGKYIARFKDLNLGNPDGIPSSYASYSEQELADYAQSFAEELKPITDSCAAACIDGRHTVHNADGSPVEVRLHRVGGSASNLGVILNGDSYVIEALAADMSLGDKIQMVDDKLADLTGLERSAHQGGCGGANGEIADNQAIADNANILAATECLMQIPEIKQYLGVGYDKQLGQAVRANAAQTAEMMISQGWDGSKYVAGVSQQNPAKVEVLTVDETDEKLHGHKENSLVVVIGDETFDEDDQLVWNLKASMLFAQAASRPGQRSYQQVMIAEIAKHIAVADRLCHGDMPILLVTAGN